MNYMPQIVNLLSVSDDIVEVYLVPKAFITERRGGKLLRVSDTLLGQEDVRDTLVALRSHTPYALGPLGREGVFSFGLQNVGRFRVSYITQRGSYVVHIIKTPFQIPMIEKLCHDRAALGKLDELIRLNNSGIIIFQGRNHTLTGTFVYSLLQRVCENYSKVIFILESPLTFLLKHGQSLVVQREVGVDVESFEEGIRDALYVNPDIFYLGGGKLYLSKEAENLIRVIEAETLLLLSTSSVDKELMNTFGSYLRGLVSLELNEDGSFSISFKHI